MNTHRILTALLASLVVLGAASTASASGMRPMPVMMSNRAPLTTLHGAR